MIENYTIHQLNNNEWDIFKKIRLEALLADPQFFGASFEKEAEYGEDKWREFIGNPNDRAMFILKNNDDVIGLTGIIRSRDNLQEANLIASYIRKEYRGLGLSKKFYIARLDWARKNKFSSVLVSHRESNIASKMANQKFGFKCIGIHDKVWNDGKNEKEVFYRLSLIDN